jgi:hypothetical protein
MVDITTEQNLPFVFKVVDGRGRPAAVDGTPTAVSSDATVANVPVALTSADGGKTWNGMIESAAPGACRIAVTADSDITPEGVSDVIGTLDLNVTLDPRTGARIADLQPGTPEEKPV